jgi:protein SCO1/2
VNCTSQDPRSSWRATAIATGIMLCVATAALWSATLGFRGWTVDDVRRLRVQSEPPRLSSLRLETSAGQSLMPWGHPGEPRVWLVTFMYTRCPTICSLLGTEYEHLQHLLASDIRNQGISLLSISFDLEHDDVGALDRYATRYHADPAHWEVAVAVSRGDLGRLERQTGITVIDDGFGGFTHNAAIHVVLADGRLVRIVDLGEPETALAWARKGLAWH